MKKQSVFLALVLAGTQTIIGCAELKQAGTTIGHTTRDVTREIGHGTRDAAKAIGKGTVEVVESIKEQVNDKESSVAAEQEKKPETENIPD